MRQAGEKLWGYEKSDIYIWKKDIQGLGYSYRQQYEVILFFTQQPTVKFYDKTESNVWECEQSSTFTFKNNEKDNLTKPTNQLHPTIKPTSLIARAIKNSTIDPNSIILDIFGGSGSTLIACERMKRNCRIIELDEYFCNVIIDRWEKLTGEKAVKEETTKKQNS